MERERCASLLPREKFPTYVSSRHLFAFNERDSYILPVLFDSRINNSRRDYIPSRTISVIFTRTFTAEQCQQQLLRTRIRDHSYTYVRLERARLHRANAPQICRCIQSCLKARDMFAVLSWTRLIKLGALKDATNSSITLSIESSKPATQLFNTYDSDENYCIYLIELRTLQTFSRDKSVSIVSDNSFVESV